MIAILIILILLSALYLLSLMGRTGHPGLKDLRGWKYAHRGLHNETRPENSMAAFQAALDAGCGIELDVHLLADGNLAVMHDSSLKRTTGREGRIEDLTTQQLKEYHLGGTEQTIPTFREVLDLYAGKAPLIIELKAEKGNHAALTETACKMMEGYDGVYCMESFDPRCVYWLRKHRPEIIRGQLSENFFKSSGSMSWALKFVLTHLLANFLTRPDFVAYKFADRKKLSPTLCRKFWHIQGVSWTLQSQAELDTAATEGWIPIFENFRP